MVNTHCNDVVPIKKAPANLVPAAAVIREVQALFGIIGRKGRVGGAISFSFNSPAELEPCEKDCSARV